MRRLVTKQLLYPGLIDIPEGSVPMAAHQCSSTMTTFEQGDIIGGPAVHLYTKCALLELVFPLVKTLSV